MNPTDNTVWNPLKPSPPRQGKGGPAESLRKREKLSFPLLLSLDRNRKHNLTHRAPDQAPACSGIFVDGQSLLWLTEGVLRTVRVLW